MSIMLSQTVFVSSMTLAVLLQASLEVLTLMVTELQSQQHMRNEYSIASEL